MKNVYLKYIVSGMLLTMLVVSPLVGLAKEKDDDRDAENKDKSSMDLEMESKASLSARFMDWYHARIAKAQILKLGEKGVAPVISELTATSTSYKSAKITWMTDVHANSSVWFSTTTPVNASSTPAVFHRGLITNHVINLKKLEADTTYYVVVGSKDRQGDATTSAQISFKTEPAPASVNRAPVIEKIVGPDSLLINQEGTWTVTASDKENGVLTYAVDWGDTGILLQSRPDDSAFVGTSTFSHRYTSAGTYNIRFTVKDDQGLTDTDSVRVKVSAPAPVDTTAPVMSNAKVSVSADAIVLAWKTDEKATSRLFFGTTASVDTSTTTGKFVSNNTLTTDHELKLSGLQANTLYFMKAQSTDASGNAKTSGEFSVSTLAF